MRDAVGSRALRGRIPGHARDHTRSDGRRCDGWSDIETRWRPLVDRYGPLLVQHTLPLLEETQFDGPVVTSERADQILLVVSPLRGPGYFSGFAINLLSNEWHRGIAFISMAADAPPDYAFFTVASHEIAHVYQGAYLAHARNGGPVLAPHAWAMEGGATALETEATRRWAGIAPDANRVTRPGYETPARVYDYQLTRGQGDIGHGYYPAARFASHLVARARDAGTPHVAALGEVLRGLLEGWYDRDRLGQPSTGLGPRMEAMLGDEWDAADALMQWTLASILDDVVDDPAFQDPSILYRSVWYSSSARLIAGGGARVSTELIAGSAGYVEVRLRVEPQAPIGLTASVPGVRWAITRVE